MSHVDPTWSHVADEALRTSQIEVSGPINLRVQEVSSSTINPHIARQAMEKGKELLQWMKHHHYNQASEILELEGPEKLTNYLISDAPSLIDQVIIIDQLTKSFTTQERKAIHTAISEIATKASCGNDLNEKNNVKGEVIDALIYLGKIAYLIDKEPQFIKENAHRLNSIEKEVENLFLEHHASLKQLLLSPESLRKTREVPREVAKIVLTSKGFLNIGLLHYIAQEASIPDTNYGITLKQRLTQLYNSPVARAELYSIKSRDNINKRSSFVVRVALDLDQNQTINDRHMQLTALTAALSHIRQYPSFSCFSFTVCSTQLNSNIEQAIKDFKSLLQYGKLQRSVGEHAQPFPFLLALTNKNLNKKVSNLRNYAALYAASKAMQILSPDKKIHTVLKDSEVKTVDQVLRALAQGNEERYRKGCFAFEAYGFDPLLGIWSNSIAGMAEGSLDGMLKTDLFHATMAALDVEYHGLPENKQKLVESLEKEIILLLMQDTHYYFDPFLSGNLSSSNFNENDGGFILYGKDPYTPGELGPRIDTAEKFQALISSIIAKAAESITSHTADAENRSWIERIAEHLSHYTHSEQFLDILLENYFNHTSQQGFDRDKLDQMDQVPWIARGGNDTEATLQIYHNYSTGLNKITVSSSSAEDLLNELVTLLKENKKTRQQITARIKDFHAFVLLGDHPSVKRLIENDASKILEHTLIHIGMQVANWNVSKTYAEKAITSLSERVESSDEFLKKAKHLIHSENTFFSFAQNLHRLMLNPSDQKMVDEQLVNLLPHSLKNKITHSMIHIADTNWRSRDEDLHLCFLFNPCTKKVELWSATHTGRRPTPLNQSLWAEEPWDIYYSP